MAGNRRFIQIMAVLVILLGIGVYFLYDQVKTAGDRWPFFQAPRSLTSENRGIRREIDDLLKQKEQIVPTRQRLEELKIEYELAGRVLPRESTPDQLIAAIRTKAVQSGVIPDKLTPSTTGQNRSRGRGRGPQASFEEWTFSLTIRGTYDQIATFINRMEEFEAVDPSKVGSEKRFFRVQSVNITANSSGLGFIGNPAEAGRHTCSLVMQTYRYTGTN